MLIRLCGIKILESARQTTPNANLTIPAVKSKAFAWKSMAATSKPCIFV